MDWPKRPYGLDTMIVGEETQKQNKKWVWVIAFKILHYEIQNKTK